MTLAVRATCSLLALGGALAQAQAPVQPGAAAPAAAAAYQDRVIEGLPPASEDDPDLDTPYDRTGWPRFLRLETRLGTPAFDDDREARLAYAIYGLIETPNHGVLSIDGSVTPGESQSSLTVRQRELPLPGGWVGHHELGVINAPLNAVARLPSRVQVPSSNLLGLRGEWEHAASGVSLLAANGEPGQLTSLPASGFEGLGGRRSALGAQWHLGGTDRGTTTPPAVGPGTDETGWTLAVQHERASGIPALQLADGALATQDASATLLHLRHEAADLRTQGQLLRAQNAGQGANGFWIDIDGKEGPRQHGLSIYRLEPGLSWAGLAMPSDVQGATVRSEWRTRQWSAEGSYDWLRSISGRAASGSYASASARWRLDRSNQLSAGAALRRFDGNAWTSYTDWRWQNDWGTSGLRLELASATRQQGATREISHDQEWLVPQGWTVSTSLGLGRYGARTDSSASEPAGRFWSAALAINAPISSHASARGQWGTEKASNGQNRHNLNLGAQWRLTPRWSLDGNYTRAIGRSRSARPLDPLAPIVNDTDTSSDRSFQVVLRYEISAGSRSVPLGGRASEGGGRVEGTVFFDANRSGTQDASETGAPGVTVTLDNRYAVRTDAQGRFSFPFVASGPRTVTVRNESLPLPWSVVDEGQARVDVRLRETTQLSLPVQRSD
ncbi:SdrD B-like domain-containing protein [Hydrogenophaga sp. A37]|uniref:SdrD B-like domain-containing protein n=1 Tax=Hydrogenophaga sp. A37 TaxID=1945864 RepID=UPI00098525ED|nr:SdrD B-like domain-containing protein [Hydrogenophaga sp. A37]OOG81433.1 hypothetical protein B0E41_17810 [Hydrogenophaga sp. A37]